MKDLAMWELSEEEHEREVKEYILDNFSEFTQIKAVNAIKDLLEAYKSWRWIHYAIMKKSSNEWERYGFGLMFNDSFNGCVNDAIRRDYKLAETDYSDIHKWLSDDLGHNEELVINEPCGDGIEELPQVQTRFPNGEMEPYLPLDELANRAHASIGDYVSWLAQTDKNTDYLRYETKRLEIEN